jgi:DDE superfamily endonuclease
MLLSPNNVLDRGLDIMNVHRGRKGEKKLQEEFHAHFGSSPLDIAECWYDLCFCNKSVLSLKEKSDKGFKQFLAAQHWLWARPKNAAMFASRFGMSLDYVRGNKLWLWIGRIANLAEKKIVWDKSIDSQDTEVYAISADGVDFKLWERQHPEYPIDTKAMSHKFRSCGAKYIIALSVFQPKCLFIEGPFKGGRGDLDMFIDSGLMKKMKANGKVCIADRGFRSKYVHERKHFAFPDAMDSKPLNNFKSRARCRQETYNRRLKHFQCLSSTFTNGFVKHGIAVRAVAVMVQYQMDNGSPIFFV